MSAVVCVCRVEAPGVGVHLRRLSIVECGEASEGRDGIQPPMTLDTFEGMRSAIFEPDPRAGN